MSAGHHDLDCPTEIPAGYWSRTADLVAAATIDRGYTIPYLANRSQDGRTVYIDESVPAEVAGLATSDTLPWHELAEWLAMNDGLDYRTAHETVADPVERRQVERLGGDWAAYCAGFAPLIRDVDDETITRVPSDIDLRPYEDDHDKKAMAELAGAEEGGRRQSAVGNGEKGRMKSAILTPHEFARLVADASGLEATPTLRTSGAIAAGGEGRSIGFVFSDESVARDGHTIATRGWELASFQANPVFLFAHDDRSPPIGRVTRIAKSGTQLVGTVEFADEATYPFADTIFRLFKGGFLNATSVSWLPLEWKHSSDKSRPYGIDFLRQELLEISAVPVPALPTALVTARAAGIDTKPLSEWASRMLDDERSAVPRDELETIRREARMPSAGAKSEDAAVGNGQSAVGSDAAAETTPTADCPLPTARSLRQRGLYHVAAMCDALEHCRYVHAHVCAEAAAEGDGSPIPDRMGAWLDEGHRICAAMAAEETQENIDGTQDERTASLVEAAVSRALRGLGLARAGKRLSAETERCLRAAHAHVTAAHKSLEDVLDPESDADPESGTGEGDDTQDGESDARALRARKAAALRRRVANSE